MALQITTAFPGEFLEKVLTKATISNELVENNLIHIEPNILKELFIGSLVAGQMLQHRKEMPTGEDAKGDFTYEEKSLKPQDMMAYTEYNPRNFETIWRKWQPNGPMAIETWSAQAQAEFLEVFAAKVSEELGNQYINGVCVAGDDTKLINGIVPRILADKEVKVAGAGETTYVGKFGKMLKALPKAIRKKRNLKFITSVTDSDNYDAELKGNVYKNADVTVKQTLAFNGIPVVGLAQWPEGLIVLTLADNSLESNLWGSIAWGEDETFILSDKVSNAGEKYFLKMLMKADTNIAFGDYVVICDEREADGSYIKSVNTAEDVATVPTAGAILGSAVTYINTKSGKVTVGGVELANKGDKVTFYFDGSAWQTKA